jgi:hypothetical protein
VAEYEVSFTQMQLVKPLSTENFEGVYLTKDIEVCPETAFVLFKYNADPYRPVTNCEFTTCAGGRLWMLSTSVPSNCQARKGVGRVALDELPAYAVSA